MTRRLNIAAQHGYSMVAVMLVMLATSILAAAAFKAVGSDIPFARASQDRKQAYAAAEAGLEYYLYQLARDNDYWTKCTNVPEVAAGVPAPINLKDPDPGARRWRNVAGSTEARFSIELLPANGETACNTAKPEKTMLDENSGTFRIRSTGQSRGVTRSIVAVFRRTSFLDYLYFTDYETSDPLAYTNATDRANAATQCVKYRAQRAAFCTDITFPDFDKIRGPLHTNDDLLTCGSPDFGRDRNDAIEISGPQQGGWKAGSGTGCSNGTPDFLGTKRWPAPMLSVPTSNNKLLTFAQAGGRVYYGQTTIEFNGDGTMDTTSYNPTTGVLVTENNVGMPNNGVIFVDTNTRLGCSSIDGPLEQDYSDPKGCPIVTVHGSYTRSMTIGSAADILIDGNLTRAGDHVLGLVATNFVRVKHGVRNCPVVNGNTQCFVMDNVHIEAAILTLAHSFIVDNYSSGAAMGSLKVDGAIAQRFRGAVGTFNSSTGTLSTGYTKDYAYDVRLRYRSPPFFLDPISAAWRIIRANEQVKAAKVS
jgi:type II secretory pathway pseudopilin PulG